MKRITAILALASALALISTAPSTAAQVRGNLGKGYVVVYDTVSKSLDCISENKGSEWTVNVANGVPSMADWAGAATSAGPVFVYTSGGNVSFALFRWQKGSTNAEKSGESLRGGLAQGRLLSANWEIGPYGAKVTVDSLSGSTLYTTTRDINMWGTGKQLSQTSQKVQVRRVTLPGSKVSYDEPPKFTSRWDAGSSGMGIMPSNSLPMGMLLTLAEPGVDLPEFARLFMRDIGPAIGATDLKEAASKSLAVGAGMPGLLRIANGTMNGKAATFAFVFVQSPEHTVVATFATRSENYDTYANVFYGLLASLRFQ